MTSAKDEKIIKELRSKPENKKCMDCTATFPTYVVLDFGTWVCTQCSGVHREFSHKVKSPTMATFKPEEIQILQNGGNEIARKKWRARWTPSSFPEPESGDVHRVREFIKLTYKEKKWFDASGTSSSNTQPNHPPPSTTTLAKPTAPPATIRNEPKSLIDFDFDVIPNNPVPPNNNNMYMPPASTNPFGNPFQAPNNNGNNGLDAMFSNLNVSPNPTNPFATPVNNNSPMYDPKLYPPFMPNNNMPNTNPFPVNTAPTNPFSVTQPAPTTNNISAFDFDSLDKITSTPSPNSVNTSNNGTRGRHPKLICLATIRPPPATIRQPAPPKEAPKPQQQDDTPRCPICNMAFDIKKMSNAEINVHVDNCLEKGPEDSWAEWFNLARMEWYFGDIDRKEAEKILFRCSHDSFLVRKSSVKDAFAVSLYNHKKQTVVHSLIEKRSNGWAFQDTYRIYPTLVAVISDSPECKGLVPPPK